jgi:hypothetical protein
MTVFLTGDNFQRNLTAKDANRMLKAAREVDAGAGNLTSSQVVRAWQNGHIFIRNDHPNYRLPAYSTIGIGPALYEWSTQGPVPRTQQWQNVWRGQRINLKQHWFRHGVIQQSAAVGEIVPCAIDGITFAIADTPILNGPSPWHYSGVRIALNIYSQNDISERWEPWTFIRDAAQAFMGQARLLQSSRTDSTTRGRILIKLNDHNSIWRAVLTNRDNETTFDGYLSAYGTGTAIKIYDPMSIMPGTADIPTGSVSNLVVGVEITQGVAAAGSDPEDELADIEAYIVCVNRTTALTGVQLEEPII